ncbi:MAG: hypothetical protein P4L81_04470 [Candidatus Pacebacteria bacterium]|nr:hypothetical protein [Candidatus Paceibacterota bacterium]
MSNTQAIEVITLRRGPATAAAGAVCVLEKVRVFASVAEALGYLNFI